MSPLTRFAFASLTAAAALVTSMGLTGCAAAPGANAANGPRAPSRPVVDLPTRAEIAAIPRERPPAEVFPTDEAVVDAWTFDQRPPGDADAYDDPSPWGRWATELVTAKKAGALSPALRCAAAEVARFRVTKGAMPSARIVDLAAARCGAASPDTRAVVVYATARGGDDAMLFAHTKDTMARLLDRALAPEASVGVATARAGESFAAVAVIGREPARLEATSRQIDGDRRVTIRGAVRDDVQELGAWITRGDVGVDACARDPKVALPRFAFTCRLAEGDAWGWVEVASRRKGRLLGEPAAEVIVYEDASKVAYRARTIGGPALAQTEADVAPLLVDRVNRVRAGAGLAPLSLEVKQSAENARLTGTLLATTMQNDPTADRIALGMMAGWEVDGTIRRGDFFLARSPTRDVTRWLDHVLARPLGRKVLLDADARRLAVGTSAPDAVDAMAITVTTYALFGADDPRDAQRAVERIAAARAQRGAPAPTVVAIDGLARFAKAVNAGELEPGDAIDAAMRHAVDATGSSVRGWVLETNDLGALPLPDELLRRGPLRLGLAVTHHKARGAAWGQYVVLVVVLQDGAGDAI